MPIRIQRKRTKGWKMPLGAVYVGRPSRFGNPFDSAEDYEQWLDGKQFIVNGPSTPTLETIKLFLEGFDLACWCPLDQPCHADILLKLANTWGG